MTTAQVVLVRTTAVIQINNCSVVVPVSITVEPTVLTECILVV